MPPSHAVQPCPRCQHSNPTGSLKCALCDSDLGGDLQETVVADVHRLTPAPRAATVAAGMVFASRYRLLSMIGQGGMGTVYQAHDSELDRVVALKVIRPDLASNPEILERFKQELILSRQISHRNVIRIYDLGVHAGQHFITMEHIEGEDLSDVLQRGRLPVEECVRIVQQVCLALEAAHQEGVVHRDLKPQNIMVGGKDRVWVMDFGLARTVEAGGMTQTGAMLGTPNYMSPEQARGERADHRSDLYSLGIMLYEMLTGVVPYRAETMLAALLKRTQEPPARPESVNPEIPSGLAAVVMKCLVIDREQRYQSAREIHDDLALAIGGGLTLAASTVVASPRPAAVAPPVSAPPASDPPTPARMGRRKWIGLAAGATAVGVPAAWWFLGGRGSGPASAPLKPVTLLVADFANETGDSVFDGAMEPTFNFALEGAGFVAAYNRSTARRTAAQLKPGLTRLDEEAARLVAVREGISVVVTGSVRRDGGDYRVSVRAVDAVTGKVLMPDESASASRDKVLSLAGLLAGRVRKALGDSTPESVQLAAAETFTAASLEAAQTYSRAQEARFGGKAEEAIQLYLEAAQLDPRLGSAYWGLAVAYSNLGQRGEARKYYETALAQIDRMSDREKYRTRGAYYLTSLNHQKALQEFTDLARLYPGDIGGLSNLAFVHYLKRDMKQALADGKRALDVYPKNALLRSNYAMYGMYSGDFALADREAGAVIQASPTYVKAYNTLALSRLAQGQADQARDAYTRMAGLGDRGVSFAAMGLADLALYQGRVSDAVSDLTKGIAHDIEKKFDASAAKKRAVLASAQLLLGRRAEAVSSADRATADRKEEIVCYEAARVYLGAGQPAKAMELARSLAERLETDPRMYAKLIEGEAELARSQPREALSIFEAAQAMADTWLGRLGLARAYLELASFAEANSELERCLARKGEAVELFLDEVQTLHYFPQVEYYIGRSREGLKSEGAKDSYRAFLAMKRPDSPEPMVADARRRLGR